MAARQLATPELFSDLSQLYATIARLGNYKIQPVTPEATAYGERLEGALATAKQVVNDVFLVSQQAWQEWVQCGAYFGEDVTPLPINPQGGDTPSSDETNDESSGKKADDTTTASTTKKAASQDKAMWAATAKPEQMFTTWSTFFHLYADAIKQYRLRVEKEARDKVRQEKAEEQKKLGLKHSSSANSLKKEDNGHDTDHFMRHLSSIRKAALAGGDHDDDTDTTSSSISEPKIKRFSTMMPASRPKHQPPNLPHKQHEKEHETSPASLPSSFASPPQSFASALTTLSQLDEQLIVQDRDVSEQE